MQINESSIAQLFKGYRALYMDAYQGAKPVSDPMLMKVPSSHNIENYNWLGAVPGMKLLVDEVQVNNITASTWQIANNEYEDTIGVKQKDIENDSYGIYNPLMSAMGIAARQHPDELSFGLLTAGFTTTDYTGTPFFYNGKFRQPGDAGFSNLLTSPLNQYAYRAARANIRGRLNPKKRPMMLGLKLVLVCGAANEPVARQIVESDVAIQAVNSGSGIVSGIPVKNVDQGTAEVMVSPYIDAVNPAYWFLIEMGLPLKPLVFQENKAPVLTSLTSPDSDHVFKKKEFLYQAYGRYAAGYLMPDLAVGSTGAGSALTQYP